MLCLGLSADYGIRGRTYRYLDREPLYPFGFGLSYTRFAFIDLRIDRPSLAFGEGLEAAGAGREAQRGIDGDGPAQRRVRARRRSARVAFLSLVRRASQACAAYAEGKPSIASSGGWRHGSNCLADMHREDIFIT